MLSPTRHNIPVLQLSYILYTMLSPTMANVDKKTCVLTFHVFKYMFWIFKQYYTYFHIFFHSHLFLNIWKTIFCIYLYLILSSRLFPFDPPGLAPMLTKYSCDKWDFHFKRKKIQAKVFAKCSKILALPSIIENRCNN